MLSRVAQTSGKLDNDITSKEHQLVERAVILIERQINKAVWDPKAELPPLRSGAGNLIFFAADKCDVDRSVLHSVIYSPKARAGLDPNLAKRAEQLPGLHKEALGIRENQTEPKRIFQELHFKLESENKQRATQLAEEAIKAVIADQTRHLSKIDTIVSDAADECDVPYKTLKQDPHLNNLYQRAWLAKVKAIFNLVEKKLSRVIEDPERPSWHPAFEEANIIPSAANKCAMDPKELTDIIFPKKKGKSPLTEELEQQAAEIRKLFKKAYPPTPKVKKDARSADGIISYGTRDPDMDPSFEEGDSDPNGVSYGAYD